MNNTQSPPATTPETPESTTSERDSDKQRKQPIPRPSEPKQYRAIGLVRGKYTPGEELTCGTLTATDGTEIDAVLLGRVISLVKNHLDLEQSYLWVVYPRTRKEQESLHVQIAGVWEPALLHQEEADGEVASEAEPPVPEQMLQDGYFSVRGEVIYYSQDEEEVIVKIQQMPRKQDERRRFFKVHLNGVFPGERPLGRFWDIHALLEGGTLAIQEAEDIGIILKKRRKKFGGKPGGKRRPPGVGASLPRPASKAASESRPRSDDKPQQAPPSARPET